MTRPLLPAPEQIGLPQPAEPEPRSAVDRQSEPPLERAIEVLMTEVEEVERARRCRTEGDDVSTKRPTGPAGRTPPTAA